MKRAFIYKRHASRSSRSWKGSSGTEYRVNCSTFLAAQKDAVSWPGLCLAAEIIKNHEGQPVVARQVIKTFCPAQIITVKSLTRMNVSKRIFAFDRQKRAEGMDKLLLRLFFLGEGLNLLRQSRKNSALCST